VKNKIIFGLSILFMLLFAFYFSKLEKVDIGKNASIGEKTNQAESFAFERDRLKTNTEKSLIPLDEVLDGGPGKDGIPAINNPVFTEIKGADRSIKDDVMGIIVKLDKEVKFYPYNILVWHEIVNDKIGDKKIAVTFCPLCGSAIVFETDDIFGVSGKLYESNLLMYDKKTESLWSQSEGMAVVGGRISEKLKIYSSQILSYMEFKSKYPSGKVLSVKTGYNRDYTFYPYGGYENSDEIYFPVIIKSSKFKVKELMHVFIFKEKYVAIPRSEVTEEEKVYDVLGEKFFIQKMEGEISVKDLSGKNMAGYTEMWFSFATHHEDDGIVLE
jgi:hypothetical protein